MKTRTLMTVSFLSMLVGASANEPVIFTDWEVGSGRTGTLGSASVSASASGADIGVSTGGWNVNGLSIQPGADVENIGGGDWDSGDMLSISLSSAQSGLLLYIVNFDLNSAALIEATGSSDIEMLSSDGFVSFEKTGPTTASLTSLYGGADGRGNCIVAFSGHVSAISINWTGGDQKNGVNYTLAQMLAPTGNVQIEIVPAHLLRFQTQSGASYLLQESEDLKTWTDTKQNLVGDGTVMAFCVEKAKPIEFYRIVTQ